MARPLAPCPTCRRHVIATESICPFCAATLPQNLADAIVPGATQRLTRAAAVVFTASLAVAACGGDVTQDPDGESGATSGGSTSGDATSGATTSGGGTGGAGGNTADAGPDDDGGNQTLYGLPPADAGMADDGGPGDDGGSEPLYGAAPVDAGDDAL